MMCTKAGVSACKLEVAGSRHRGWSEENVCSAEMLKMLRLNLANKAGLQVRHWNLKVQKAEMYCS